MRYTSLKGKNVYKVDIFRTFRGDFDVGKERVTMPSWPCFHQLMVKHKAQKEALLAHVAYFTSILCATPL